MSKDIKALKDDALDNVSGGVVRNVVLENIDTAIAAYKLLGVTEFEEFKKIVIDTYNENPAAFSTTGSEEDLQEILSRFEAAWNK